MKYAHQNDYARVHGEKIKLISKRREKEIQYIWRSIRTTERALYINIIVQTFYAIMIASPDCHNVK